MGSQLTISRIPDALMWNSVPFAASVVGEYQLGLLDELCNRLVAQNDVSLLRSFEAALIASDDNVILALLARPNASNDIRFGDSDRLRRLAMSLCNRGDGIAGYGCDTLNRFLARGVCGSSESLLNTDFSSDLALMVNTEGAGPDYARPVISHKLSSAQEETVLTKLGEIISSQIFGVSGAVEFCATFSNVTCFLQDQSGCFSSGTTWQFIGRSYISNAHQEDVYEVCDALIHESIHGFLYMMEYRYPWVHNRSLFSAEPIIRSPWSGRLLPFRPYLQACFVWFGLSMFWGNVCLRHPDDSVAQKMLARAVSGFLQDRLVDAIGKGRDSTREELLFAIDSMQSLIASFVDRSRNV